MRQHVDMDVTWWYLLAPILLYLVGIAITLLLLYGVIRVGVARGMRDHQLWMERNRPQAPPYTPLR
jgi:uncharacterized membrane protein